MRLRTLVASGLIGLAVLASPIVPSISKVLNGLGCGLVHVGAGTPAYLVFRYLEWFGSLDARNNLGVLYLRGIGVKRDRLQAVRFFRDVARRDHVAGRYNLVLMMPNRHKTPDAIVRRQFELLQANILQDDAHSMVLMAARLYYMNRVRAISDPEGRKLELLRMASATGDRDYLFRYAKELWRQAWVRNDSALAEHSVPAALSALEAGEPRAAELLAQIHFQSPPWLNKDVLGELYERDPYAWLQKSADYGRLPAICKIGNGLYKDLKHRDFKVSAEDVKRGYDITRAIQNLKRCANDPYSSRRPAVVFGTTALYARKALATYSGMANSRGWATLYLGEIYEHGIGVKPDLGAARRYYARSWTRHKFTEARDALSRLPN